MTQENNFNVKEKTDSLAELCLQAEELLLEIYGGSTRNFRKLVGIHLLALISSTAGSVVTLLSEEEYYASAVLLRTMVEQWVNLRYIYLTPNYENLVRYFYDGDMSFIRKAKKAASTFKKYGGEENYFKEFEEDAIESIEYRVSSSDALRKYNHPLACMPSFWDRVKSIVDKDNDYDTMVLYLYDYLAYSTNVHTTKDKVVEMTYAETYSDWFQAVGDDSNEDAFRIISSCGEILEKAFGFFTKRIGFGMKHKFFEISKNRTYFTNMLRYQEYKKNALRTLDLLTE